MMKPPLSSLIGNHASTTSGAGLITSGSAAQVAGARNLVNAAPAALPSHPNTTSHSNAQQPVGSNPAPALPAEQSDQVGLDYNASVDILCDFLEVAIHMILYARQLYPMESFERRKKFNVPVYMNRHPELNRYILDIVSSLRPWMEKRLVTRVAVNVVNPVDTSTDETAILERFVFEVQAATLPASRSVSLADIELMLRAVLIKISLCDALLQPVLAKDLETQASGTIGMYKDHRLPWIMAEPRDAILANPFLHPLKSVHTGLLQMQLFVEERAVEEQHVGLDPGQAAMQT
ncbi:mitotic arrest defective protein 2B [Capsaspora owczarzaki ATCC 30864]|uniref:mitotic arrest defective protein 2B n=1 Tax=Capsaspora owczarzaki (strain ATCC 30864) TaxID=595528 RepID=UPI0003525114|nr:mitotic arrest defective protein 2B [Capsaspora owczarzaki ATCC 30864]|eukprot:XP_004365102.2 mitotic arrest defective protein 2B [Capsaspora owczarzaki ATCC 30864]